MDNILTQFLIHAFNVILNVRCALAAVQIVSNVSLSVQDCNYMMKILVIVYVHCINQKISIIVNA